jgi:major vault protein
MNEPSREKRDLVLPPGTYAYMQDVAKGNIKIYTGPTVVNPSAQERPVKYSKGVFSPCDLDSALSVSPVAVEGYYLTLLNPAKNGEHPNDGSALPAPDLDVGRKVNIAGPAMFALWPGQSATVTRGHHLRFNQYLLVRVYNDEEARENWGKGVMKPAGTTGETPTGSSQAPKDLTLGKMYVIKGTEFSFYIPPTGITVVPDEKGQFVRDALTLERLEYSILIDEDGTKRYEYGPKVVFPEPTEKFFRTNKGDIKFRAIELNPIQGIHVKVISDYADETVDEKGEKVRGKEHKTGEELFITGAETAIYYPREEHAIIKYDGKTKHFATAIPNGEARYVLGRETGKIKMIDGPKMLLPDPRTEVIVRRVLSDSQCERWYPGNEEALAFNRELRNVMLKSPTTRAGAVSEGDYERSMKALGKGVKSASERMNTYNTAIGTAATVAFGDASRVGSDQDAAGDEISRGSTYTQPRSITLDTKYQGAPNVQIWTGYAIMVVNKQGGRKVEQGPKNVLLQYDEDLEVLSLSTGKPKNTDKLLQTVYLRTENNSVTDIIQVETADHVTVNLKLCYRVSFEGDSNKWFTVENYVKYLCDHVRSVLKGLVRLKKVEDFYANSTEFIRNSLLGPSAEGKRKGMLFPENGMHVTDVEVLAVEVTDQAIRDLLNVSQQQVVRSNIDLETARRNLEVLKEKEGIARDTVAAQTVTTVEKNKLAITAAASAVEVKLAQIVSELKAAAEQSALNEKLIANEAMKSDASLASEKKAREQAIAFAQREQEQKIAGLVAETEAVTKRFAAAQEGFSEALLALSNNETLQKVAQAWSLQRAIGGESVSEALQRVFSGSPVEGLMKKLVSAPANGTANGEQPRPVVR